MQNTVSRRPMYQLSILSLAAVLAATGCNKKTETTDNATAASVAESQAIPMSAAPADGKRSVAIDEANATVDAGPETVANASATAAAEAIPASGTEVESVSEGEADNSGMDKITENDKVIDNEPASPNAPKAIEDSAAPTVANQKVGQ